MPTKKTNPHFVGEYYRYYLETDTAATLARALGLHKSNIYQIFEGDRNLTVNIASRIEKETGIPGLPILQQQLEYHYNKAMGIEQWQNDMKGHQGSGRDWP